MEFLNTLQWTGILCECIHRVTAFCCIVVIATKTCTHNKAADTLAVKDHLQTHKDAMTQPRLHHKTLMLEARHMRSVDSTYVVTMTVMERNMSLSKTHEGAGSIAEAAEQKWCGCDTRPTRKGPCAFDLGPCIQWPQCPASLISSSLAGRLLCEEMCDNTSSYCTVLNLHNHVFQSEASGPDLVFGWWRHTCIVSLTSGQQVSRGKPPVWSPTSVKPPRGISPDPPKPLPQLLAGPLTWKSCRASVTTECTKAGVRWNPF